MVLKVNGCILILIYMNINLVVLKIRTERAVAKAAPFIPTISKEDKGLLSGIKIKLVYKAIENKIK